MTDNRLHGTAGKNKINKRSIGARYEAAAAAFLTQNGLSIIARNYSCRRGEIDIIAMDAGTLCFIEVKYRSSTAYGYPSEAVGFRKQQRIIASSEYFILEKGLSSVRRRYDVIEIIGNKLRYLKNSFGGF